MTLEQALALLKEQEGTISGLEAYINLQKLTISELREDIANMRGGEEE
jgi:hypothetical protein